MQTQAPPSIGNRRSGRRRTGGTGKRWSGIALSTFRVSGTMLTHQPHTDKETPHARIGGKRTNE